MPYSVFLSSTQKDLKPFRETVSRALKRDGHEVVEMERFGARSEVPLEVCLQEVVNAEVFVGIYARRYGFVPRDSGGASITELEYREARRAGRPCYCYCVPEDADWPQELCEPEAAAALKRFKDQVQADVGVDWFRTPEELADKVGAVLRQRVAPAAQDERSRRDFLDHVQRLCIDDWLLKKAPAAERLRIRREDCPRAVDKPEGESSPADPGSHPAVVPPLHDTFGAKTCQLLVLGRNGAGKTISLLELCQSLLREARRDPESPIPVVLNLGSWRWHDLSFATWMKREIRRKYAIGKKRAEELVDGEQVLPLLDGLDEVDPDARSACVDRVTSFLASREYPKVAVCCQGRAYDELPERLHLGGAVALQSLTREQIAARLTAAGPDLAALREAVEADEELRKLADTPLMLVLLERTCRGADPDAVRELLRNPAEDRRKQVFDSYVSRMLEPELDLPWTRVDEEGGRLSRLLKPGSYPPGETRRRLGWLATRMREHDRELLPEQLQPSWLPTAGHRLAYAVLSRALAGLLLMAPLALFRENEALLGFGLLAGALAGAMDAPRLRRSAALGQEDRTLAQNLRRSLGRALLLFVLYLVVGAAWQGLGGSGRLSDLPQGGVFFGTLFGLVLGTRGTGRDGSNDIHIRVRLKVGRWSWRGTLWGAASLLLFSLAFWGFSLLRPDLLPLPDLWVAVVPVATLLGAVGGGALGALEDTPVPRSALPNRGIRWTLLNAGLVALSVMAVLGLCLGALLAGLRGLGVPIRSHDWRVMFESAVATGIWAGLWFSGLDFVQHCTLRLLLRAAGLLPLRLTHFLSYLTGRGLMQRTGSRYSFESQLLDHFASSSQETP